MLFTETEQYEKYRSRLGERDRIIKQNETLPPYKRATVKLPTVQVRVPIDMAPLMIAITDARMRNDVLHFGYAAELLLWAQVLTQSDTKVEEPLYDLATRQTEMFVAEIGPDLEHPEIKASVELLNRRLAALKNHIGRGTRELVVWK